MRTCTDLIGKPIISVDNGINLGTVKDLYLENSYNQLNLESTVLVWVKLPYPESYYANGNDGTGSYPQNAQGMCEDALNLVDPYVDFSEFDNDGDRYIDRFTHTAQAVAHQLGFCHQAGAKTAGLYPVGRAADIQVDLIVAPVFSKPAAVGQFIRVAAAQLNGNGVLAAVKFQVAFAVTMKQCTGGDHFRVEQYLFADQAQEKAAMPVGPVQHRGNGKCSIDHSGKVTRIMLRMRCCSLQLQRCSEYEITTRLSVQH